MKLENILEVMIKAARLGSKAILEVYHSDFTYRLKDDRSVVTQADFRSDMIIRNVLLSSFPDYGILTEESKESNDRLSKKYTFIVDPLDGTKDFVNRTDNFSINIAFAIDGEIKIGVIAVPTKDLIYFAIEGQGAYKLYNGEVKRLHVSNRTSDLIMVTSAFFFKADDKFSKNPRIKEIKAVGSSYKACLIAEGEADFCVKYDDKTKEWDVAPNDLIVHEAGGVFTDKYGNKLTYNKADVINRNGFLCANNQEVLDLFKIYDTNN